MESCYPPWASACHVSGSHSTHSLLLVFTLPWLLTLGSLLKRITLPLMHMSLPPVWLPLSSVLHVCGLTHGLCWYWTGFDFVVHVVLCSYCPSVLGCIEKRWNLSCKLASHLRTCTTIVECTCTWFKAFYYVVTTQDLQLLELLSWSFNTTTSIPYTLCCWSNSQMLSSTHPRDSRQVAIDAHCTRSTCTYLYPILAIILKPACIVCNHFQSYLSPVAIELCGKVLAYIPDIKDWYNLV